MSFFTEVHDGVVWLKDEVEKTMAPISASTSIADVAAVYKQLKDIRSAMTQLETTIKKIESLHEFRIIELIEASGLKGVAIDGVGKVTVTTKERFEFKPGEDDSVTGKQRFTEELNNKVAQGELTFQEATALFTSALSQTELKYAILERGIEFDTIRVAETKTISLRSK